MPDLPTLGLFVAAALVLLITPGPAVLFVVTRSLEHGRAAGIVSTAGLSAGGLVHAAAAVLGLSAVLAASAVAFETLRYAGAAYLVYLGVKTLRSPPALGTEADRPPTSRRRLFLDGLLVNLLNPKAAVFFLAFLPQFVDPAGPVRVQLAGLGLLFLALGFTTDCVYALAASSARRWLRTDTRIASRVRYLSAAIYFGLGAAAALTGRRSG